MRKSENTPVEEVHTMPTLKIKSIQKYGGRLRVYAIDRQFLREQQKKYDLPITAILEEIDEDKIILTVEKPVANESIISESGLNENFQKHCNIPVWQTHYFQLATIRSMGAWESVVEIPRRWVLVQSAKSGREVTELYEEIHGDLIILTPVQPRMYRRLIPSDLTTISKAVHPTQDKSADSSTPNNCGNS